VSADAFIDIVAVDRLRDRLGLQASESSLAPSFNPLTEWSPQTDDAPILRYIFRHLQPRRHIEIGAADSASAGLCLEECDATVWRTQPVPDCPTQFGDRVWQRVDGGAEWNGSTFEPGFFDSSVIYGGRRVDQVSVDTQTALSLVRSAGLIIWRDFCPDPTLHETFESTGVVVRAILDNWTHISASLADAFWIRPSFLLAAIRR